MAGASACLRQGRLEEAEVLYRKLLVQQPDHPDVLHFLGVVLAQRQQPEEGAALIDRSLALVPDNPTAHLNRGNVHRMLRQDEAALASYSRVLDLDPESVDALLNRGAVLVGLKRYEEALENYGGVLAANPGHREAALRRSALLSILKRPEEALDDCNRALQSHPADLELLSHRGALLMNLKLHAAVVENCDRILAIRADHAETLNDRGIALAHLKETGEALHSYDRAIAVRPDYAEAHSNRGVLLADAGRYDEALKSYDRALKLRPNNPGFLNNRGGLFRLMGMPEQVAQDYARLLELKPGFEQALSHKLFANVQICDWTGHDTDKRQLLADVRAGKRIFPFTVAVLSDDPAEHLAAARTYVARKYAASTCPLWTGERYRHDRIRVAYLSADFYLHATAHLMVELFERHDRGRFEVSAWSFGPDVRDDMNARLRQAFEQFIDVRDKSDDEVVEMLRTREIDIAVDLKGYSKGSRPGIFARRLAPIQVNYLVYPGTTGADYMDYIIGDHDVIPEGDEIHYSEHVVRMPDSYQVNGARRPMAERTPCRADAGLPDPGFVFCCFNNTYKVTPQVFDVWMRLLRRVDGSVLWLLEGNAAASRNLRLEAAARGVDADRLVFATRMPPAEHLARHKLADLFLDTVPCNAHTTASDALWAGLPLLTCRGHAFPGRVAAGLLRAAGLPELITDSLEDYEALAYRLATNPALLTEMKSRLAVNRISCPLFDIESYRRHIESAYVTMFERYQQGLPPQGFSVKRLAPDL